MSRFRDRFRAGSSPLVDLINELFEGDDAAAAAWLAAMVAYVDTGAKATLLLNALEETGDVNAALLKLDSGLASKIEAFNVSPAGLLVASVDGFTSTLPASFIYTVT